MGEEVDIARILANELKRVALNGTSFGDRAKCRLIFPGLIMGLCRKVGVRFPSGGLIPMDRAIDDVFANRFCSANPREHYMEEDPDIPLILGRPFMKTARMMIDIDDGLMKLRYQDEELCLNLFEAIKHPTIFSDLIEKCIEMFLDDFSSFGASFDLCLKNLDIMLSRCVESNLVLNWEKCNFMVTEGIVLGHKVSSRGLEVDKAKIEVIEKLPPPLNVKGIRIFLGHAGFYRRFIKYFCKVAKPLSNILNKGT
ncbi:uncharacterized protein LOC131659552 [Vicia villosa]|uniref:uncharacterized protein LOC131659552 n=1 Tax=Vicia villosa TaxID=3911 RepID=UPI00273B1781|nr:uncharacterized protein LOC131659552 [Vicia villosa]